VRAVATISIDRKIECVSARRGNPPGFSFWSAGAACLKLERGDWLESKLRAELLENDAARAAMALGVTGFDD
jgi:hypothetical protein